jgi:hypothetical protein
MRTTAAVDRDKHPARRAIVLTVVIPVIGLAALAMGVGACGGGSSPAPTATVTVTATPSPSLSASPSPSPSGASATAQLVVAVASGPKANGISVVSGTGKVKQLVAPSGGPIRDLSWAPGGVRLAFLRAVSDTNSTSSLFVYNVSRKLLYQVGAGVAPADIDSYAWVGPTQIIESYFPVGVTTHHANGTLWLRDIAKSSGKAVRDSVGHVVKGVAVSASADGMHVAYVTYGAKSGETLSESLRIFDANDLAVSTVSTEQTMAEEQTDEFTDPSISPDGALIATEQTGSDVGFACTVYGIDGAKRLQATGLAWPSPVSWTSHGPRLAFGGAPDSGARPIALNVWQAGASKATAILKVVNPGAPITSLAWTPKASQLAYAVIKSSGLQSALWICNADGSNRHLLLTNGSFPAWAVTRIGFP